MVFSKINPEVKYKETASISPEDIDIESSQYDIVIQRIHPKKTITVVFGNVKYNYSSKNVLFYPIYLVVDGETKSQIGIIEITMDQLTTIIDDDGDIDPENIPTPILYGFVNKEYILKYDPAFDSNNMVSDSDSESDSDSDSDSDVEKPDKKSTKNNSDDPHMELFDVVFNPNTNESTSNHGKDANTVNHTKKSEKDKESAIFSVDINKPSAAILPEES